MKDNPFQPPESNLFNKDDNEFKRSIWWKIYFFVFTSLYILSSSSLILEPKAGIAEIIDLVNLIAATVGLYGFVFLKPIYKPDCWFTVLILSVFYGFFYFYITDIDLRADMTDSDYYFNIGIGWFISMPSLYALYSYSRSTNPIWNKLSNKKFKAF